MLYIGIPAHNEATTIGVLLWRLRSVLADVSREYEVVVYDDASTDETAKTLEPYTRVLPLTLLSGSRRVGYAGAVDALVRHVARATRYPRRDALLLLQGDFTDPPALVPEFLRRFEGGADLIIGERASAGDAPTAVRRLWSASRWVLRPFVGVTDVRDLTSSYRLVRIAVLRDLLKSVGDAPVATGDVWAANADFLLRTAALSRRVETIPVTPTFGVRTRETRRAAWPDTVALAKWGWGRRGQRVAVKVIARTVDAPAEVEEAPSDPVERITAPERAERGERRPRRDSGERGERSERSERGERVDRAERGERSDRGRSGGERKSRERAPVREREAKAERDPTTELVVGASPSESEGESGESSTREGRPRRKRGRRDRTRKEPGLTPAADVAESTSDLTAAAVAPADTSSMPDERPSSRSASVSSAAADAETGRAEGEDAGAAEGSDTSDVSEEGVARRRKRTRRGRRRKSGSAGDGTSANGSVDEPAADRAPRAASPEVEEQEAAGPRERTQDDSESDTEDVASVKRRRSRRGRRGGARRRDGNGEGAGEGLADSGADGRAEGGSQDDESRGGGRRNGPEGADRSDP